MVRATSTALHPKFVFSPQSPDPHLDWCKFFLRRNTCCPHVIKMALTCRALTSVTAAQSPFGCCSSSNSESRNVIFLTTRGMLPMTPNPCLNLNTARAGLTGCDKVEVSWILILTLHRLLRYGESGEMRDNYLIVLELGITQHHRMREKAM